MNVLRQTGADSRRSVLEHIPDHVILLCAGTGSKVGARDGAAALAAERAAAEAEEAAERKAAGVAEAERVRARGLPAAAARAWYRSLQGSSSNDFVMGRCDGASIAGLHGQLS